MREKHWNVWLAIHSLVSLGVFIGWPVLILILSIKNFKAPYALFGIIFFELIRLVFQFLYFVKFFKKPERKEKREDKEHTDSCSLKEEYLANKIKLLQKQKLEWIDKKKITYIFFIGFATQSWIFFNLYINMKYQSGCSDVFLHDLGCLLTSLGAYTWWLWVLHIVFFILFFIINTSTALLIVTSIWVYQDLEEYEKEKKVKELELQVGEEERLTVAPTLVKVTTSKKMDNNNDVSSQELLLPPKNNNNVIVIPPSIKYQASNNNFSNRTSINKRFMNFGNKVKGFVKNKLLNNGQTRKQYLNNEYARNILPTKLNNNVNYPSIGNGGSSSTYVLPNNNNNDANVNYSYADNNNLGFEVNE
jgi:hypothetical protein